MSIPIHLGHAGRPAKIVFRTTPRQFARRNYFANGAQRGPPKEIEAVSAAVPGALRRGMRRSHVTRTPPLPRSIAVGEQRRARQRFGTTGGVRPTATRTRWSYHREVHLVTPIVQKYDNCLK
jgi:hypothetical protein